MTDQIIDAAVHWESDSYVPGTYMCISFQFRKHLSLGRGGIILFDKEEDTSFLGEQLGARRIREIYGFYCEDLLYISWSTPRVSYWQITLLLQELFSFYK